MTTKTTLSASSVRVQRIDFLSASAPWLTWNDCAFLMDECGEDFLHDFISARFCFSAVYSSPEMWIGDDGELRTLRALVDEYNTAREDEEAESFFLENEIESFDDFMDYQTAMGGFLRELDVYYGITVNGYDMGLYFEDIESAFDEAELAKHRGGMGYKIEIVRYVVSDNN